jgi:hypothetical protein
MSADGGGGAPKAWTRELLSPKDIMVAHVSGFIVVKKAFIVRCLRVS